MLDRFYKWSTDLFYLSRRSIRKLHEREPGVTILAYGATKARKLDAYREVQREPAWIVSRRATLILTTEKLICGDWEIPLTSIAEAKLMKIKAFFARGLVLKIRTHQNEGYHFGLQYDPAWEQQTSLPVEIEEGKIGYSKPSIVLRIVRYIIIAWLLITWGSAIYRFIFN